MISTTTVQISDREFNSILKYIEFQYSNQNPCINCTSKSYCCGCPKETEYQEFLKNVKPSEEILNDITLSAYIDLSVKHERLSSKIKAVEKELSDLQKEREQMFEGLTRIMKSIQIIKES